MDVFGENSNSIVDATMQLYFRDLPLGAISGAGHDGPDIWASFEENTNAAPFLEMWSFITEEANYDNLTEAETRFPVEYFDDTNWSIVLDDGKQRPIHLPAVYEDGTIAWRWRD